MTPRAARTIRRRAAAVFAVAGCVVIGATQLQAASCDPAYVSQNRQTIVVVATGVDDSSNLQCAIDAASALGSGATVQLLGGVYKTAQLVVAHMRGAIRGIGYDRTRLQNLETPLPIDRPESFAGAPPSADNRYPSLITILGTDVVLSDFTIVIGGDDPVAPWSLRGQSGLTLMANAVQVIGSGASLDVERLGISGSGCYPDGNMGNGISVWTFGTPGYVAAPALHVQDSFFNSCGGIAVESVRGAFVAIESTRFDVGTPASAVYLGDVQETRVAVDGNRVNGGQAGVVAWGSDGGRGFGSSTLFVRNNAFSGITGVVLRGQWSAPIECGMIGNSVRRTEVGFVLMPSSFGCTIVGNGASTALDLTDGQHVLVGITLVDPRDPDLLDLFRALR